MVHIGLNGRWAELWCREGERFACGSAHDGLTYLDCAGLAAHFRPSDVPSISSLQRLNGSFALMSITPRGAWAVVDRVRSIPIFYGQSGRDVYLGPDAHWVAGQIGSTERDPVAEAEFTLTGYVTGSDTLVPEVKQLEAGQFLVIERTDEGPVFEVRQYDEFRHVEDTDLVVEALLEQHDFAVENAFRRLLDSTHDRPIVIPLSGGYDSRLIALMLHRLGRRDVTCFSYGRPGNAESSVAEQVARALGFNWLFIPYDERFWSNWFHSEDRRSYYDFADGLSSIPHLQDWPAVGEMRRKSLVPTDAVFVPGHAADFVAGSHIPLSLGQNHRMGIGPLCRLLRKKHYALNCWSGFEQDIESRVRERLTARFDDWAVDSPHTMADAFEWWDWQERQAKFIANAVRVYEYWGYAWRLPFWDVELMNFWKHVPLEHRMGSRLYCHYVLGVEEGWEFPAANARSVARKCGGALLRKLGLTGTWLRLKQIENRFRWRSVYQGHPLAWFGVMSPEVFRANYTGREHLNSFLVREYLGRLRF